MCGIIGKLSPCPGSVDIFTATRDRMLHRGPDDAGFWQNRDGTVLLGHRRLSILDLSLTGHQPMVSACGRFVIVFNGEIYNYLELKADLECLGHGFQGTGDTEVILAAFREWGDDCLQRLNGMFAFAIWDQGTSDQPPSLFMARDAVGEKPLYYAHNARNLAFASELKAIPREMISGINSQALNYYLSLGYIPSSLCIARGVNKLPPAHAARFRPDSGNLNVWRWWQLPLHKPRAQPDPVELVDEAEAILRDAVRLRMRSDVPVGVLLSGGIDSSLIVACAAEFSEQPIKTFTMGLPGSGLDETKFAAISASHFGTEHHVLEVAHPSLDVLNEFATFVDEPIADSSLIPAYMVSKFAVQHVKVALGGDGGDELFGGYGHYKTALDDHVRLGWLPSWAFRGAAALAAVLPVGVRGRNRLAALRGGPFQSMVWGSPFFDPAARARILTNDVVEALGDEFLAPELSRLALFQTGLDPVDSMVRTDFGGILPDDFLVKMDRASMAVSLELRSPLLDPRLVEFAFGRLPSEWKVAKSIGRPLQKRLARRMLPSTLDLERKQGFSVPMDDWMRSQNIQWREGLGDQLSSVVNQKEIQRLIEGQARGRANGARLFSLLMLSMAVVNLDRG